jgi:hypothetical protein
MKQPKRKAKTYWDDEAKEKALNEIFDRISKGESLNKISKSEHLPNKQTFYEWIDGNDKLGDKYTRARKERNDHLFEEILDIADESANDYEVDEYGKEKVNNEAIQRSRLRIDARKWMLGKLDSKKYGDKIQQELSGEVKGEVTIFKIPDNARD